MIFLLLFLFSLAAAEQCASEVSIELVLDGSTSITSASWKQALSFMLQLSHAFSIGPTAAEFGVVQFSSSAVLELSLSGNATAVEALLESMPQMHGGTAIGDGLAASQADLVKSGRTQAKPLVILMTDGSNGSGQDPIVVSNKMKGQGIEIFAIAVGNADKTTLSKIVSLPIDQHLFAVTDFGALETILHDLSFKSCVKVTSVDPSTGPAAGGTAVAINGSGFSLSNGTVYVRFGDQVVKGQYGSDSVIGAISPAGADGSTVEVEVSFDGTEFSTGSNVNFTYTGGASCPNNCSQHGVCLGSKCLCNSGWSGPACDQPSCPGTPPCSGHGTCSQGTCQCDQGFSGPDCSKNNCPNGCGSGTCTAPNTCECKPGFQGDKCQFPIIVCCHYCGIYNPKTQWNAECDKWTPDGPDGSPCKGYSDQKLVKWWVQGSVNQGNCTDSYQCIFPGGVWDYPRACISNYGYCN